MLMSAYARRGHRLGDGDTVVPVLQKPFDSAQLAQLSRSRAPASAAATGRCADASAERPALRRLPARYISPATPARRIR
jgi:hypothetical protein